MASASAGARATNPNVSSTPRRDGNETPDPGSSSNELLRWILRYIIQDPLGDVGAELALLAADVRGFNEFLYLGYRDIETLGYV